MISKFKRSLNFNETSISSLFLLSQYIVKLDFNMPKMIIIISKTIEFNFEAARYSNS